MKSLLNRVEKLKKELIIKSGSNDEDFYIYRLYGPGEDVEIRYCFTTGINGKAYEKPNIPKERIIKWDEYIKEQDQKSKDINIVIKPKSFGAKDEEVKQCLI